MAEDSDLEKTESATPRRRQKAREEGQVARSRELVSFALLSAGFFGAWGLSGQIGGHLEGMLRSSLTFDHATVFETRRALIGAGAASMEGLKALAPLLFLTGVAALVAPIALGGWLLSSKSLEPKWNKLNPISGLGRIFSPNGVLQLGMALAKTLVVGVIGTLAVWNHKDDVLALVTQPMAVALASTGHLIAVCCAMTVAGMFLIAALDVPYQIWQYEKKLRMTKEEVKREHRENEGDPHVKGRIRAQQRAAARRRMMQHVPKADVVVTNPTHFAVALQYTDGKMRAPKVVAKGVNLVAARIRDLATENNVPLLEAPPLARALYYNVRLDAEVPGVLYGAVAEVLAWVYQLRRFNTHGGAVPVRPSDLDVPAELDKRGPAADEDDDIEDIEDVEEIDPQARGNGRGNNGGNSSSRNDGGRA
ncbi:flagellar type III secretion system protein FlhB [Paraburkholderia edwinii]|uniref:Flagellar biosynthetic protein FlhB n=1 Tax=Paraburkholderia edwinii TaxID=2861782 RepID=A0ABX8ULH7_9BURK|nr:flagellar biosynthesis protein FlhB [Paraburkholderia edwinii]QYD69202.1 flagellar type III secretion system protein FlhB [Paraburkholderia edwinii]